MNKTTDHYWKSRLCSPDFDQAHLLKDLDESGVRKIIDQIAQADANYPGGLQNYLSRARALLRDSKAGVNPFAGFQASCPPFSAPEIGSQEFYELERVGLEEIAHCAFVLVAGGLGERLGYPDIKIGLVTNITNHMTYCEFYFAYIFAYQMLARARTGRPDLKLPVAIMTSGDTYTRTVQLLQKYNYFDLDHDQVTIMLQEKVPALIDNDAHIAVKKDDPTVIELKPHGHGDVHTLLHQNKLASKWAEEGFKWLFFFQDTNALSFRALPCLIGVSVANEYHMNSLCVPRSPGEAVGAICHLKKDTLEYTVNVEYNQLDALLKSAGLAGDVAPPGSKHSPFPGNCNILLFRLDSYRDLLAETGGAVPEFVNPKYADASKTAFKSATRVECMMQEFARLYRTDQKVGATVLPRWFCFSTVKNNIEVAATKLKQELPSEGAFSGELELYENSAQLLRLAAAKTGCKLEIGAPAKFPIHGMDLHLPARIVVSPRWSTCLTTMCQSLKSVSSIKITQRSSLVLDGKVDFKSLDLDGDLKISAPTEDDTTFELGEVRVRNPGSTFRECSLTDPNVALCYRIRGYSIKYASTSARIR